MDPLQKVWLTCAFVALISFILIKLGFADDFDANEDEEGEFWYWLYVILVFFCAAGTTAGVITFFMWIWQ